MLILEKGRLIAEMCAVHCSAISIDLGTWHCGHLRGCGGLWREHGICMGYAFWIILGADHLRTQGDACNLAYSKVQVECDVCRACSIQAKLDAVGTCVEKTAK